MAAAVIKGNYHGSILYLWRLLPEADPGKGPWIRFFGDPPPTPTHTLTPLISKSESGTGRTSNGLPKSPPQQHTNFSEFLFYHQRNCWKLPFPFYWLTLLIPNIHIQILKTDLHTFLYNLTEFIKRSKHFLFSDHFLILITFSLQNIVRRKLMMVTFCKLECHN